MPYPAQTDRKRIVEIARQLIEREGIDQLALGRLASELGIKAPSLYRHVSNKDELLRAVVEDTFERMFAAYAATEDQGSDTPAARLHALCRAHRSFAKANPRTYVLAFSTTVPEQRANPQALERLAVPIQALIANLSGQAQSLAALRGMLALIHGFVMLELMEQFQRGGDLNAAYEDVVAAYLRGWG